MSAKQLRQDAQRLRWKAKEQKKRQRRKSRDDKFASRNMFHSLSPQRFRTKREVLLSHSPMESSIREVVNFENDLKRLKEYAWSFVKLKKLTQLLTRAIKDDDNRVAVFSLSIPFPEEQYVIRNDARVTKDMYEAFLEVMTWLSDAGVPKAQESVVVATLRQTFATYEWTEVREDGLYNGNTVHVIHLTHTGKWAHFAGRIVHNVDVDYNYSVEDDMVGMFKLDLE